MPQTTRQFLEVSIREDDPHTEPTRPGGEPVGEDEGAIPNVPIRSFATIGDVLGTAQSLTTGDKPSRHGRHL